MKKTLFKALAALFMSQTLVSCITTSSTGKINRIDLGMTKE